MLVWPARYSPASGPLSVRAAPAPSVDVNDDGPGIPEQQLELLGQRGTRLDQSVEGHGIGLAIVERIVAAVGAQHGWVVFDEAYQPFASRSWMPRLAAHPHVMVMRTLSKFGLAGVRLGYLIGPAALVAPFVMTFATWMAASPTPEAPA